MAVVLLACASAAEPSKEVAIAVDACSAVGATAGLETCAANVEQARVACARMEGSQAATCRTYIEDLWVAALEAYRLRTGECDALTSAQARSLCLAASPQRQASPSAPALGPAQSPAPAVVPAAPQHQPDGDEDRSVGNGGENRRNKEDKKPQKD